MYDRILVPLDGSPPAETALVHARGLAAGLNAGLVLVRIIPTDAEIAAQGQPSPDPTRSDFSADVIAERGQEEAQAAAREYLEKLCAGLRADGIEAETRVAEGRPADQIALAVAETGAGVIVLTTYGEGGAHTSVRDNVFGGVADAVLRSSRVPVLVVRPDA